MILQTLQDNLIINELERVFDRKILFGQMASAAIHIVLLFAITNTTTYVWQLLGCPC